ncbi:MAG: DUF362 domain-containing protein [Acidobacteriota bacterium]|nr:MAG: DUF362 domain-containing protein [Acidobacteriota bacterium]
MSQKPQRKFFPNVSRRGFLITAAAGVSGGIGLPWYYAKRYESGWRASVFVGRAESYQDDLEKKLSTGMLELGIDANVIRDRSILLKPNLVEPYREARHINTHPLFVEAAAKTFLRMGAETVIVGEGAGHRRDSKMVLAESGFDTVLSRSRLQFIDLNVSDVYSTPNLGNRGKLSEFWFPEILRKVDFVVSIAKMKTHHWMGVTLSMKNLFGLMPGIVYGWPKNLLHYNGIEQSILDICETVKPDLAIVDGITGMEGDGPLMGEPVEAGVFAIGRNLPAVDATCARIMGIDPSEIGYLYLASGALGPIRTDHIEQRGENPAAVRTDFRLLEEIAAQKGIRLV